MVKNLSGILILLSLLLSCHEDDTPYVEQLEPSDLKITTYLIEKRGFNEKDISILDDVITVGDLCFDRVDIDIMMKEEESNVAGKSRRSTYLVTAISGIPVYFESSVPNNWKTAVRQGMSEWNSLGGDVYFYETTTNFAGGGVKVRRKAFSPSNAPAHAWSPSTTGYPGHSLEINSNYNESGLTSSKRKHIATHELGHTIGFMHTDTYDGIAIYGACETTSDPTSVMHAYMRSWTGFSTCDILAFNILY